LNVQLLPSEVVTGLVTGSTYVLVAIGFTLIYGVLRLINFAQLSIYTVGAFVYVGAYSGLTSWNLLPGYVVYVVAAVAGALGAGAIGLLLAVGTWYPIRRAPSFALLVASLATLNLLQDLIELFISPIPLEAQNPLEAHVGNVFGVTLTVSDLVLLVVGIGVSGLVALLVARTRFGLALRSVADNPTSARLMGVPYTRIVILTFALAAALAGLAGAMVAAQYGVVSYDMGVNIGLFGFTAAVLGGMGNVWGAVVGGFLLGVISSLAVTVLPSAWQDAITFGVLIIVLAVRPTGILATRTVDRA
jgi:branched-chain amino acid transport system permease protein